MNVENHCVDPAVREHLLESLDATNKLGMDWSRETCLRLIDEYEKQPILWNNKDPSHFSRNRKTEAWETIAKNMKHDVPTLRQKVESLLASFRRERMKEKKNTDNGNEYESRWFAYQRMQFLLDRDKPLDKSADKPRITNKADNIRMDTEIHESQEKDLEGSESFESQDESSMEITIRSNEGADDEFDTQKTKRRKTSTNLRVKEEFLKLKQLVEILPQDECSAYCQYLEHKLRRYNGETRAHVEYAINNILYEADMGKYKNINSH